MNRSHDLIATFTSLFAAIAAWQEQLEWGFRLAATAVALTAGILAIRDRQKRRKAATSTESVS